MIRKGIATCFLIIIFFYRVYRVYNDFSLTRDAGVPTAVNQSVSGCKRRYDLELTNESVWIEILVFDGLNLLVGNHYFPPNTGVKEIENFFNFLETNLNKKNFRLGFLSDFNVHGYGWVKGFPHPNLQYCNNSEGI
jgi:hypothetical protein